MISRYLRRKQARIPRIAQNELAKELYGLGVFNPQMADQALCVLRMMDFDRRDEVIQMIERNGNHVPANAADAGDHDADGGIDRENDRGHLDHADATGTGSSRTGHDDYQCGC